ncbi:hypothetical protein WJX72_009275 [[Myrmecia] bisecta]|uniref:Uncharacterized protein n=1 Tax=[Myrmecia] bisecta TaxID=41462 RepID=A0AAW1PU09_9CHLO
MVRHTKKEVNHGTYPLTTEEQAALKLQQQAASRKGRLLQVRQQEKVFAAQRARAYKERLHRCQKQIGQSLQDQWEEERQTALQQLEEQHARAMDMFGEGQRAALDAMQQHYAQKQLAAAKLAAAAHTAEQRFQEAHARLQADREAAMHDEVARLQRLRDTAQAEYARAAELVAAFRAKLDSEQVAKAAADQAEAARLQRGLYSGVDFRYTRLHEMGVPKLVEKHEGAGADGEGLDVQEAAQRATDGMWQHAERKVLATIENQETAEERGQAASLRLAMAASKQRMEAQLAALERAKREYKKHQAAAADPAKAASLLARRNNNDQKQKALERDFEAQFLGQARQPAHDAPTQAGDGSPEVPLHWTDYMPAGARQVPESHAADAQNVQRDLASSSEEDMRSAVAEGQRSVQSAMATVSRTSGLAQQSNAITKPSTSAATDAQPPPPQSGKPAQRLAPQSGQPQVGRDEEAAHGPPAGGLPTGLPDAAGTVSRQQGGSPASSVSLSDIASLLQGIPALQGALAPDTSSLSSSILSDIIAQARPGGNDLPVGRLEQLAAQLQQAIAETTTLTSDALSEAQVYEALRPAGAPFTLGGSADSLEGSSLLLGGAAGLSTDSSTLSFGSEGVRGGGLDGLSLSLDSSTTSSISELVGRPQLNIETSGSGLHNLLVSQMPSISEDPEDQSEAREEAWPSRPLSMPPQHSSPEAAPDKRADQQLIHPQAAGPSLPRDLPQTPAALQSLGRSFIGAGSWVSEVSTDLSLSALAAQMRAQTRFSGSSSSTSVPQRGHPSGGGQEEFSVSSLPEEALARAQQAALLMIGQLAGTQMTSSTTLSDLSELAAQGRTLAAQQHQLGAALGPAGGCDTIYRLFAECNHPDAASAVHSCPASAGREQSSSAYESAGSGHRTGYASAASGQHSGAVSSGASSGQGSHEVSSAASLSFAANLPAAQSATSLTSEAPSQRPGNWSVTSIESGDAGLGWAGSEGLADVGSLSSLADALDLPSIAAASDASFSSSAPEDASQSAAPAPSSRAAAFQARSAARAAAVKERRRSRDAAASDTASAASQSPSARPSPPLSSQTTANVSGTRDSPPAPIGARADVAAGLQRQRLPTRPSSARGRGRGKSGGSWK